MSERAIFIEALSLEVASRPAFLDRACGPDAALRKRVERLLALSDSAFSLLDAPAAELHGVIDPDATGTYTPASAVAAPRPGPSARGESIGVLVAGRYKLAERIGEGGMGSVWLAEQTEPVKRKVAVKLIKAGLDSKQVLARFEAERQALALMDHPNIAKVLDGGVHDGRPFFVMELVKGVPITAFCDARRLTPQQRLELFVPVCQAIQHAHQKGVIHRDIKPANVLVALYDDRPVPKVIDFGVAKATGPTLTEHTLNTGFGGVVGTPQYMSPEQATFNNLDIDTRSDVYSLGVLLYELLTGSPPFHQKELEKRGLLEVLRVVREEDPPRPSTKLSTADALPSLAADRGTEPKKLTGLLRNELDWIVMKALEKDRSRRYESANGFAADVLRYLAGEPVQAHPPSRAYRLRKFVRKNRGPVLAVTGVFAALVAGIAGTTLGLFEAQRQAGIARREADAKETARQAEAEERAKAEEKEAEANAVVQFFQDKVLSAGRPKRQGGGLGPEVSLRDAVTASLPALDTAFVDRPLVEARLRRTLGTTFSYLGQADRAAEQLERARELFTRHRGPDHLDTLASIHGLASSYTALRRHEEAFRLREEVLAGRRRVLSEDHTDVLGAKHNLAISHEALGRHDKALRLREEVLAGRRRVLPENHPDTLASMNNLANSYVNLKRREDALALHAETLDLRRKVLPEDHPDTLISIHNVGTCYVALDRFEEARKLFAEALAVWRRVLPEHHPETLTGLYSLADVLMRMGRGAEAVPLLDEYLTHAPGRAGVNQRNLPRAIDHRLRHFWTAGDATGCRTTAEKWEKLGLTDANSLYTAATCRAVTAAVQAKGPTADPARARADANRAMDWLNRAVKAGWKDSAAVRQEVDFAALRDRDDFKKLLAELEAKFPPKREMLPAPRADK